MIDAAGMPGRARHDRAAGATTRPYLLTDMADDTFGLMDHLGIDSAHVVGASMGGMIGQTMAITQPERVRSLVSMMSTTGNRRVGSPHLRACGSCFADYPRSREAYVKQVGRDLRGDRARPASRATPSASGSWRGGCTTAPTTPPAIIRQMHAISGLRRPHPGAAEARPADHRAARHRRPARPPGRRPGHRQGDPRRPPADLRGHGPRPAARALARVRRGDRRNASPAAPTPSRPRRCTRCG